MGSMLTRDDVESALVMLDPAIKAILAGHQGGLPDTVWGPPMVRVCVIHPEWEASPATAEVWAYEEVPWKEGWKDRNACTAFAQQKATTAQRVGMATSILVAQCPDMLVAGDLLYAGGYAEDIGGLAVGVSGARGIADEAIAKMVFLTIIMFCQLYVEDLRKTGQNMIA